MHSASALEVSDTSFVVVWSLSHVRLFPTPWTATCQPYLSFTIFPEFAQAYVHWVSDAIWLSHPLSSPSPPALNLSQCQGLFSWVSSSHQVANELELQLQHQSFQWIFRVDFLYDWQVWSPCWPNDLKESSSAPQLESIHSLVLSLLYGPTLISAHDLLEKL